MSSNEAVLRPHTIEELNAAVEAVHTKSDTEHTLAMTPDAIAAEVIRYWPAARAILGSLTFVPWFGTKVRDFARAFIAAFDRYVAEQQQVNGALEDLPQTSPDFKAGKDL
jgi:hypothetical protein